MAGGRTSSGRLMSVVCGASCSRSGSSSRDAEERFGEGVERFFAFRFGRLDHDRFFHREREVDGRRVEAVVEEPLGEVHRGDAFFGFELGGRGDELVHAAVALRHRQEVLHAAEQVVGVEHGVFADAAEAVGAVGADVAVGADEDADVAEEGADAADGFGAVVVEASMLIADSLRHDRRRQIRARAFR